MYKNFLRRPTNALVIMNVLYYVVTTAMFRPLTSPSLGGEKQEWNYNYILPESVHN